jgi:alkanesulfonate monooxygenase SsuD/methylene tetrahydromethanopterin reductase-like flavin-dependent oxidoreductase (luciferase family)
VRDVTVGVRLPHEAALDAARLREFVAHVDDTPVERVFVGDHVTFRDGTGFDGLQYATAIAALSERLTVQTAVYLLPLRHPVPVARQVTALAWLAPGRFVFGVGVGGEDPGELRACGVDPASRGRRLDESLSILRELLAGRAVSRSGPLFELDEVTIAPPPPTPVPIVVGGRSEAALRRAARFGDGWLGVWVSPQRYSGACQQIAELARSAGREVTARAHGMHVWCGFGADRESARRRLAGEMELLYGVPFEKFERYCPFGSPEQVADALRPYVAVGCRTVNLIATAESPAEAVAGAVAVRALLGED